MGLQVRQNMGDPKMLKSSARNNKWKPRPAKSNFNGNKKAEGQGVSPAETQRE